MHFQDLTAPEQRVFGCLIEKKFTTPDQYPLSINALKLAANQSTNRYPVLQLDDHTINEAAQRLSRYGLVRLASGHTSRATKYRHLAEEALGVDQGQLALLCVLLLRGPQTSGELKGRTERMVRFESLETVDATLDTLVQREYVVRLGRRPGQKEERWGQLLGGSGDGSETESYEQSAPASAGPVAPPVYRPVAPAVPAVDISALEARVGALEAEVAELRALIADRGLTLEAEVAELRALIED